MSHLADAAPLGALVLWAVLGSCAAGCDEDAPIECPDGTRLHADTVENRAQVHVQPLGSKAPPEQVEVQVSGPRRTYTCLDGRGREQGPTLALHDNGVPAMEGTYRDGRRDGRWLEWADDGSFDQEVNYARGDNEGVRRMLTHDGRIMELRMVDDHASGDPVILPEDTPMPEWQNGRRVMGTGYRAHRLDPE